LRQSKAEVEAEAKAEIQAERTSDCDLFVSNGPSGFEEKSEGPLILQRQIIDVE
jgi:hypothetical protein